MGMKDVLLAGSRFTGQAVGNALSGRRNLLYFGWLGHRNLGDEALHQAILGYFGQRYGFHLVSDIERIPLHETLMPLFDAYMIGGGTLINRNETVLDISLRYGSRIGKNFIFGAGVANETFWRGFEKRPDRSRDWQRFLRSCRFVGVRGPDSLAFMESLGVAAEQIGDPVLGLGRDRLVPKTGEKRVGLNFGDTGNLIWGRSDARVWELMAGLLERLLATGWTPSLFNVFHRDRPCLERLLQAKGWRDRIPIYDASDCDIEAALRYFDGVDVFVGEKLHASVFAAISHTPFCMLEYRPKCHDFMGSLGLLDYNFRADQAQVEELLERIQYLHDNARSMQDNLYSLVNSYKLKLSDAARRTLAVLAT
jgi:polysaccharide pyruvyl transferase WcaK-like protein